MRRDITGQMPGSLTGAEIAAHGEDRHQVPFGRLFELWLVAGHRSEMSRELNPVFNVGHDVQHVPDWHALHKRRL
ncbi:hypothetical protein ALQ66_200060 [Pseudomonas savastanoi pv. glycinea]|nr:hypothetical protein ALQ66_200060 [Pseudomonas savastanoi pv. glycinea]